MTGLILKRASASRPSGKRSDDDFDVLLMHDGDTTMKASFAALAFGPLIATAMFVQSANPAPRKDPTPETGPRMNPAREKAIRECNRAAVQYPNATYGATFEIDVYRACMTQHGQQE